MSTALISIYRKKAHDYFGLYCLKSKIKAKTNFNCRLLCQFLRILELFRDRHGNKK